MGLLLARRFAAAAVMGIVSEFLRRVSKVLSRAKDWLVVTPAVSSGHRVVDGYVRVGPNRWSRRSDVSGV